MTRQNADSASWDRQLLGSFISQMTNPLTNAERDSMSSQLMPVFPISGGVIVTNWPLYEGSDRISSYPVIPVLKTTSPSASTAAPTEWPDTPCGPRAPGNSAAPVFQASSISCSTRSPPRVQDYITMDAALSSASADWHLIRILASRFAVGTEPDPP